MEFEFRAKPHKVNTSTSITIDSNLIKELKENYKYELEKKFYYFKIKVGNKDLKIKEED